MLAGLNSAIQRDAAVRFFPRKQQGGSVYLGLIAVGEIVAQNLLGVRHGNSAQQALMLDVKGFYHERVLRHAPAFRLANGSVLAAVEAGGNIAYGEIAFPVAAGSSGDKTFAQIIG